MFELQHYISMLYVLTVCMVDGDNGIELLFNRQSDYLEHLFERTVNNGCIECTTRLCERANICLLSNGILKNILRQ